MEAYDHLAEVPKFEETGKGVLELAKRIFQYYNTISFSKGAFAHPWYPNA